MRFDRVLALILIAACLTAALAAWSRHGPLPANAPALSAGRADIALVDVYGVISDSRDDWGPFSGGTGALTTIKALRQAEADHVKAIVLRINSPGGTAAASQMIYQELRRLHGRIKLVAALGDVAASGGYYVASAADRIVANAATTTGSIGVILHFQNVQGLMGKLGITNGTIQSGPHKDILSPYRNPSPEERAMLQALVDDTYQQFLEAVSEGRKLPMSRLKPLADGRIFTGRQALKVGLVDALGTYQDGVDQAARLAGITGTPEVRRYPGEGLWEGLWPRAENKLASWLGADHVSWAKIPLALME